VSVRDCLLPTHNTQPALEAAMAYARALEKALGGGSPDEVAAAAVAGVSEGGRVAPFTFCAPSIAARLDCFRALSSGFGGPEEALDFLYDVFGTGLESADVGAAALCVYLWAPDDPWLCIRMGASIGGDTDTIAALAGMLAAASRAASGRGHGIPANLLAEVLEGNGLDLDILADRVANGKKHSGATALADDEGLSGETP